jgi:hypothetical protein
MHLKRHLLLRLERGSDSHLLRADFEDRNKFLVRDPLLVPRPPKTAESYRRRAAALRASVRVLAPIAHPARLLAHVLAALRTARHR